MPIDASEVGSPGWWMNRLAMALQVEQRRFRLLEDYHAGRPPLAWGSQSIQKNFYRFQNVSKTNFASVIVNAPSERSALRSVSTAAGGDEDGDKAAWELITANDLDVTLGAAVRMARKFGRSYLATAYPDEEGGKAIITAEDPRQMITEADPIRPRVQRAALKLYYDAEAGLDVAVLWLPGEKWVATRERKGPVRPRRGGLILGQQEPVPVRFAPGSFTMAPERQDGDPDGFYSESYDDKEIPVDPILNRDGVGEFENHTDLLDRINHMILQRVVIATLQAFRQRALKQSSSPDAPQLPEVDEAGNPIDYSDILESGPDSVWLLPPGAELWESAQVDLSGILQSCKDDILHLSATTGVPLSMFTPDAISQSAEGAQLTRERLTFNVEDFNRSAGRSVARAVARAFRYMGDQGRGDASTITVHWMPAERYSLAEKGSATAQVAAVMPFEEIMRDIWQKSPQEIAEAKAHRSEDLVIMQQIAALKAKAQADAAGQGASGVGAA